MATIDLIYPKIAGSRDAPGGRCIAFEKVDGTNLHWFWDFEFGFVSFGTRRDSFFLTDAGIAEFGAAHPGLEEAPVAFRRDLAEPLAAVLRAKYPKSASVVAFTEFVGPGSFAGRHRAGDAKSLVLFDVKTDDGILDAETFVGDFGHLRIPRIVYRGKLTGKFADDVREGKFGVAEGVVCKGGAGDRLWMAKIKTHAYLQKLKEAFKDDWEQYWE